MIKICIVLVYFGEFNNYFDLWLNSCENNQTIDFLIISDNKLPFYPSNVSLVNMSFNEFKFLAEKKLGMRLALEKPYKLCDFKPVYGIILEDYLQGYDYWGHCDCDLIWGDIRSFVEKNQLEKYDKFLSMGHLSLYRNTKEVNNYYKLSGSLVGDYKKVFSSDKSCLFDEALGINAIYELHKLNMFKKVIYADIDPIYSRFVRQEIGRYPFNKPGGYNSYFLPKKSNHKDQIFYYDNGKIYCTYYENGNQGTEEYCYIHLQKRKFNAHSVKSERYLITPSGFIDYNKTIDLKTIRSFNKFRGSCIEFLEYYRWLIKRIINKIKKRIT